MEAQADHKVDASVPGLEGVTVHGSRVALNYDEQLDEASTPSRFDFAVTVAGDDRTVVQVRVSGNSVILTLTSPVTAGETVRVSYTPGFNPIQDGVGNAVEVLTDQRADPPLVTIQAKEGSETVTEGDPRGVHPDARTPDGGPTDGEPGGHGDEIDDQDLGVVRTAGGGGVPVRTGDGDVGGVDRR